MARREVRPRADDEFPPLSVTSLTTTAAVGPAVHGALRRWGVTAWRIVGILLAASMTYLLLAALSGLVVPFVLAVVVGTLGVALAEAGRPLLSGAAWWATAIFPSALPSIISSVRGVAIAGVLGAILSAPALAISHRVRPFHATERDVDAVTP